MRMSCNGCRILRKGCSDQCIIKPCLDWIKSSDSQANATLFLAKFYGRAGLLNLIEAGPQHLRPDIFKSLLYEACGRIVDPISGCVGLLSSGKWEQCHAAVEAVLNGNPIIPGAQRYTSSSSSSPPSSYSNLNNNAALTPSRPLPPRKIYDIRHVSKDTSASDNSTTKTRVKRSWNRRPKAQTHESIIFSTLETVEGSFDDHFRVIMNRNTKQQTSLSHHLETGNGNGNHLGLELTLGLPLPPMGL